MVVVPLRNPSETFTLGTMCQITTHDEIIVIDTIRGCHLLFTTQWSTTVFEGRWW